MNNEIVNGRLTWEAVNTHLLDGEVGRIQHNINLLEEVRARLHSVVYGELSDETLEECAGLGDRLAMVTGQEYTPYFIEFIDGLGVDIDFESCYEDTNFANGHNIDIARYLEKYMEEACRIANKQLSVTRGFHKSLFSVYQTDNLSDRRDSYSIILHDMDMNTRGALDNFHLEQVGKLFL
jgi:hypothetical protein